MSKAVEPDFTNDDVFVSRFPIHRACRDGDVGALVSLFQHLSDHSALTAEDSCYGWTPIHWAAQHGQLECVMRLVQMGCDVNAVSSHFKQTPTHTAAFGGHPHCVVWLTQAGAEVNRQDFVGEAPLHKAARSGSLECIQVLLLAGAEPWLRNSIGQTAADLARAHNSHHCSSFISNAQKHPLQFNSSTLNPYGQGLQGKAASRKRLLKTVENGHMKKPRGDVVQQVESTEMEPDSMNMELNLGETGGWVELDCKSTLPTSHHASADMCGSLHRTGSPSSCVSHRPVLLGLPGADCSDFLQYGHYHGFGDTAEDLSDNSSLQRCSQAGSIHLYHRC